MTEQMTVAEALKFVLQDYSDNRRAVAAELLKSRLITVEKDDHGGLKIVANDESLLSAEEFSLLKELAAGGAVNAAVVPRFGTLASLLQLAGFRGEWAFPTDAPYTAVRFTGVAGGGEIWGGGSGLIVSTIAEDAAGTGYNVVGPQSTKAATAQKQTLLGWGSLATGTAGQQVVIGYTASGGDQCVSIGAGASATNKGISIGSLAQSAGVNGIAIGVQASASASQAIGIGWKAGSRWVGGMSVGTSSYCYQIERRWALGGFINREIGVSGSTSNATPTKINASAMPILIPAGGGLRRIKISLCGSYSAGNTAVLFERTVLLMASSTTATIINEIVDNEFKGDGLSTVTLAISTGNLAATYSVPDPSSAATATYHTLDLTVTGIAGSIFWSGVVEIF